MSESAKAHSLTKQRKSTRKEVVVIMKGRVSVLIDVYTKAVIGMRALYAVLLFILAILTGLLLHRDHIYQSLMNMPVYIQMKSIPYYIIYFAMIFVGTFAMILSWLLATNIMVKNKVSNVVHAKLIIVSLSISSVLYNILYLVIPSFSSVLSGIVMLALLFLFLIGTSKLSVVRATGTIFMWHIFLLLYGAIFSMFVALPIMKLLLVK